jgi:hypothetical protein
MRYLVIQEPVYYSAADESYFYSWLKAIPGVIDAVGEAHGLVVSFRSRQLSHQALKDLIALHARYDLPMESLAQFEMPSNSSWFRAPEKYWHERVFGKSTGSRFVRSPFVRWLSDGGAR